MLFLLFLSFVLPPVLHPAPNQLVQSMADGVRVTFSRPSRPPNIPSPPPLIPTTKPTDKPSFIQGGSISQVRHQGVMAKVYWWLSGVLLLLHFYTTDIHTKAKSKPQWFPVEYFYFIFFTSTSAIKLFFYDHVPILHNLCIWVTWYTFLPMLPHCSTDPQVEKKLINVCRNMPTNLVNMNVKQCRI